MLSISMPMQRTDSGTHNLYGKTGWNMDLRILSVIDRGCVAGISTALSDADDVSLFSCESVWLVLSAGTFTYLHV